MVIQEYASRRARLADRLEGDSVAVLFAAPLKRRNRDVYYPYRPDSDFYYLTGFPEPEAVMALVPGCPEGEYVLFCQDRNPELELWDGPLAGLEGAREHYGADQAHTIDSLDEIMPGLIAGRERVYYMMAQEPSYDQRIAKWTEAARLHTRGSPAPQAELVSLKTTLHELRLYKSRHEVRSMRRAAKIAAAGHKRAMRACRPGMTEYQLEAELIAEFIRQGARAPAYPPIIGGGANGCILHYIDNNAELQDGELVLIDAGAEYHCYASDVTRTFPISGRFSPEQAAVYEIVLASQLAAIAEVRAGCHWNHPHEAAVRVLTEGLVELGILSGELNELVEKKAYTPYYMHRTGHWIGMDVHDVGDYRIGGEWRMLEPGMVMTVEPGLYLRPDTPGLDQRWWNIGIRVEDDVLVTREAPEVLSQDAPKQAQEIEAWMLG